MVASLTAQGQLQYQQDCDKGENGQGHDVRHSPQLFRARAVCRIFLFWDVLRLEQTTEVKDEKYDRVVVITFGFVFDQFFI